MRATPSALFSCSQLSSHLNLQVPVVLERGRGDSAAAEPAPAFITARGLPGTAEAV